MASVDRAWYLLQVILGDIPAALTTTRLADKLWGALLPRSLAALGLGLAAAAASQAHLLPGTESFFIGFALVCISPGLLFIEFHDDLRHSLGSRHVDNN